MKRALHLRKVLWLLIFAASSTWAQNRIITGTVTDSKNETVIGASILVKGTTTGTYSDLDGKFSLAVPPTSTTIIVKYLGKKNKEVEIGASTNLMIQLEDDVLGLDKVTITALGISKETKSLGYSTQQVGGDAIVNSGEQNFIQALSAKTAGVQITSSAGVPGASSKIVIRGPSTFTNGDNQPLIVIDGVPMDNSTTTTSAADYPFNANLNGVNSSNRGLDLNPNDIESVTVLKGPAASALYGARAGSGAIIITTKRGNKFGDKGVHINYSTSLEVSHVSQLPKLQTEYAQGSGGGSLEYDSLGNIIAFNDEGVFNEGDPGPDQIWNTDDDVSFGTNRSWGPKNSSIGRTPVDNMKDFFKTGIGWTHNLSISGGSENASVRLSLGNTKTTGVIPNTDFQRTSVRINADTRITSKLFMGGSANYVNDGGLKAQNGSNLSGVMLGLTRAPSSFDLSAGYEYPKSGDNRTYFGAYDNPYWSVYNNPNSNNLNRVLGNFYLRYQPWSWLSITNRTGTDNYTDSRQQIFSIGSNDPNNAPGGEVDLDVIRYRQFSNDLIASIKYDPTKDFGITLDLGNNLTHEYSQDVFARGRDLTIPKFYNLSNASNLYSNESHATVKTAALFADLGVDFKSILFLNLTGRQEYSSTYGPNKRSAFFPSASLSFVLSELIPQNKILSFSKLRLSWAQVGVSPGSPYNSKTYFIKPLFTDGYTDGWSFPYLGQNGFGYSQLNILGNPDIKSEIQVGREVGLELKFLNGRLNIDLNYYNQKSKDLILRKPIASTSGFSYILQNVGEMVNKGFEITADGDVLKTKNFTWNIGGNFSMNKNEVTKLANGVTEIDIESAFENIHAYAIVGQPYGALYGSMWERTPSGALLIGSDGIPVVSATSGKVGDPYPDWLANISTSFNFKGLGISGLLDIRHGGDIWGGTIARLNRLGRTEASADRSKAYLIEGEQQIENPDGSFSYVQNQTQVSAFEYYQYYIGDNSSAVESQIFDGSWVRLRQITLSYDYKFKTNKYFIQGIGVSITGRNLWLHTKYPGVDPETSLTGAGSNVSGFDYFNMPSTKSWIFNLTAQF